MDLLLMLGTIVLVIVACIVGIIALLVLLTFLFGRIIFPAAEWIIKRLHIIEV